MTEAGPVIEVTDNADAERYEVHVGDELAGFIDYQDRPGRRTMVHAEIFDRFEGHGVGSRLAAGALSDVRARGLKVVPRCPFVADFVEHHPEFADIVATSSAAP